jgi:hypothetical protein
MIRLLDVNRYPREEVHQTEKTAQVTVDGPVAQVRPYYRTGLEGFSLHLALEQPKPLPQRRRRQHRPAAD